MSEGQVDQDHYDEERIMFSRRFHHFPKDITEMAMTDPHLHELLRSYQQGGMNYVEILELMVIYQSTALKELRHDTAALLAQQRKPRILLD